MELAKHRHIGALDLGLVTPMLVPSFSSKGFSNLAKIVDITKTVIDGPTLVSAYDLHYKKLKPPFSFPSLLFLDSGGYEAGKDAELSDVGGRGHSPKKWQKSFHDGVVKTWKSAPGVPTVVISYDHPKERLPTKSQIERAVHLKNERPDLLHELLIKPETQESEFVRVADIIPHLNSIRDFSIIGLTEKELGSSLLDRMKAIAKLRLSMDKLGVELPIHIFGSLDTVSSMMYFASGADIFDGLTWLRYAFLNGMTIYKQNYGALHMPITTRVGIVDATCWMSNYSYLQNLQLEMGRYATSNRVESFQYHSGALALALLSLQDELGSV